MLRITLDVFSGLPNPSWFLSDKQEADLVERILAEPTLVQPVFSGTLNLGYRGYVVEALKDNSRIRRNRLPSHFRISSVESATGLWLLHTSEQLDSEVTDFLREMVEQEIRFPHPITALEESGSPSPTEKGAGQSCVSNYLSSDTNFSFWNDTSAHIANNNCYDFAANYRSNTFAQPGRYSGHLFTPPAACGSVSTGMYWDGWFDNCQSANNLSVALVIAPNFSPPDFHFYRLCANGHWCHKPGMTPARNTDNAGSLITNPQTCARGGYTIFCGYYYANNNLMFVR